MSEMILEHGELGAVSERLCACGCGEPLKEGAKRNYIRGHRMRAMMEGDVPPDPEPSEEAKTKTAVRVTAKIKTEMRDTVGAYLAMAGGVWSASDPVCGPVLLDNSEAIAEKLVPILARNPAFVRYFRSSSAFREGMDLMIVLYPVVRTVAAHHVFHTVGAVDEPTLNLNDYVA